MALIAPLEKTRTVYLVFEGASHVHSIWTSEEKANRMVEILQSDLYSHSFYIPFSIDKEMPEKKGIQVLVNLNSGEQIEIDEMVFGISESCVYLEEMIKADAFNYISPDFSIDAIDGEEIPKKINGLWYIPSEGISWNKALKDKKRKLQECILIGYGLTEEDALKNAENYRKEALEELENKCESIHT